MTARRSRGDGGLYWDEAPQRWIAAAGVGYTAAGRRVRQGASGRTKTEAKAKLKEIIREYEDGVAVASARTYSVGQAVDDWLEHGLCGRDPSTVETLRILAREHVIPALGARRRSSSRRRTSMRGWRFSTSRTTGPSTRGPCARRTAVGRQRPRVRLRGGHRPRCGQRPSWVPSGRRRGRPRRRHVDSPGAASQLVSLLSDDGMPLEQIARLVGHAGGSTVTETVYRKQLRPVIDDGPPR